VLKLDGAEGKRKKIQQPTPQPRMVQSQKNITWLSMCKVPDNKHDNEIADSSKKSKNL
jgi:hypothetical protein